MSLGGVFRLTIVKFVSNVWPFSRWAQPHRSLRNLIDARHVKQSKNSESTSTAEALTSVRTFWNWSGSYVGYRARDGLFHMDGHQIGYFAEGDEIYGCSGEYLGEVRGLDRLITNPSKKAWARKPWVPLAHQRSVGHRAVTPMKMVLGYEDFPVPSK